MKKKALLLFFEPFFQDFGYNTHHRVANKKSTQNHKKFHFIPRTAYKLQLLPSCNNINKIQTFPLHNYMALGTNNKPMKKTQFLKLHKIKEDTFDDSNRDSPTTIQESKPIKRNTNHTN
jgi:hypothetical protein